MFGAVSLTVDLLFRNIVMKIDVIRQHDVSHKSADILMAAIVSILFFVHRKKCFGIGSLLTKGVVE